MFMRLGTVMIAGAALVVLGASFPGCSHAAPAGEPLRGRVVYDQRCASCHGPTGRGDGRESLVLSPRPADLVSAATSAKSDKELLQTIAEGKPRTAMKGWKGTLTDDEQRDVLAYIRTLVRFTPALPSPPAASPGR